jgi:hypothetical protein
MVDGFRFGVIIQYAQRNDRNVSIWIQSWHLGATDITEDLCEVLCFWQLVGLQVLLTPDEPDTANGCKSIRRMGRSPCTATAGTMAVMDNFEWLGHVKLDGATHATSAHHAFGPIKGRLLFDTNVAGFGRIVIVTRQVAGDVMPRCAVSHENITV